MSDSTGDLPTALNPLEAASLLLVDDNDTQVTAEPLAASEDAATPATETEVEDEAVADHDAADETDEEVAQSDEAEAPEEAETPAQRTFTVRVDGEEIAVSEEELLKGYSRQADYSRKTQALAEQRKAAEAEYMSIRQEREHYARTLAEVQSVLAQQAPQEEDWDRLYAEDPVSYAVKRERARQHEEAQAALQVEQAKVQQQMQAEQQQQLAQFVQAQAAQLVERIPEWKDVTVAKAEKQRIKAYAAEVVGYSPEELNKLYDHRAVALLRKAMMFDELQARKPIAEKKIASAPKMVAPGTAPKQSTKSSEKARLTKRLAASGSVQDAAALLLLGD